MDNEERREAYERLVASVRAAGVPLDRLHSLLLRLERNEAETRRLLSDVYGVPDPLLDDVIRLRLADLARPE